MSETPVHISIACQSEGFSFEISTDMPVTAIPAALKRLKSLGIDPKQHTSGKRKPKTQPEYNGDGVACCPVHHKPLKEGTYGLYCSSKATEGQEANDKGYCGLKF